MSRQDWDILVVGAGPAGSCAALAAARAGVRVGVAERQKTIGVPVRCAGYIPKALLGSLPFRDRSFVVQGVTAMHTILPDGTVRKTRAPGLIIRRDRFDQCLTRSAREAGAEIHPGMRAIRYQDGQVTVRSSPGGLMKIRPAVIIGADGLLSTVAKWMGLGAPRRVPGLQVRAPLVRSMAHTEVYFHPRIYGAYGWVFPRGDAANVGIALAHKDRPSYSLRTTLKWFTDRLEKDGKIGKPLPKAVFGWIPVAPAARVYGGNMVLAGDAAGHTHPITGAGVAHAVLAGDLAGAWAARAVKQNDLTELQGYGAAVEEDLGQTLRRGVERRRLLENEWPRLSEILPYCWTGFREYHQDISGFQRKAR